MSPEPESAVPHDHDFLGPSHDRNERRTWIVIAVCGTMMIIEIIGGLVFGSIALVADGLHMSTHAGALLLAALAYSYSRRHRDDPRFTFGTGKFGDLAGFSSAIVLALIALLIAYESVLRFLSPVAIRFAEAIPIACLGLTVNVVSAQLLGGGHDHHVHKQMSKQERPRPNHDHHQHGRGARSADAGASDGHFRDNNMRAAVVHVMADATVSLLVIAGLILARWRGWLFMDPLAGIVGSLVIASWSYALIRDTGAVLLDMNPDREMSEHIRRDVETAGDQVLDLHLWRLGPGHLGAIVHVATSTMRDAEAYRGRLAGTFSISHLTVEVLRLRR
jgi:cation diffusion facilitator family transporter